MKHVKFLEVKSEMVRSFAESGFVPEVGDVISYNPDECLHKYGLFGVVEVIRGKTIYPFNAKFVDEKWCFFTEGMVGKEVNKHGMEFVGEEEYLKSFSKSSEKVVHESAGVVGTSRCDLTKAYLDTYGKKPLEQRYNEWVLENIHIYDLFCKFTLEAINAGHAKISHWLIVNRLRWEVEVVTKGMCEDDKEYKISNDYIAFLARDFIKDHPEHKDIFNLKQMKRV